MTRTRRFSGAVAGAARLCGPTAVCEAATGQSDGLPSQQQRDAPRHLCGFRGVYKYMDSFCITAHPARLKNRDEHLPTYLRVVIVQESVFSFFLG